MDGNRFDRISRLLARSTSRRETLKGIAAVVGGSAVIAIAGTRARDAAAQATGDTPPGEGCATGSDCTTGLCSEDDICYCVDPAEPLRGCPCVTGTVDPCGAGTLLCCPTGDLPGGPGICTSGSVGCDPIGECIADPGGSCESDSDCCQGSCSEEGICYCEDPSRPWIGCSCSTGTESPCGGGTVICCGTGSEPGGDGICTSGSVGCNPTGECTSDPGGSCSTDTDCCEGSCSEEGVCYCEDPSRPWIGCSCTTGTEGPCGGGTALCCPTGDDPGGEGICTSSMTGCDPTGCHEEGESCEVHTDCCGDLICDSNVCIDEQSPEPEVTPTPVAPAPITTLPSTGAGSDAGNSSQWLGAAAATGVAALVLRKLQKSDASVPVDPE